MWAEANEDAQEIFGAPYVAGVARSLQAENQVNMPFVRIFTEALAAENPKDRYVLCPEERLFCSYKVRAGLQLAFC